MKQRMSSSIFKLMFLNHFTLNIFMMSLSIPGFHSESVVTTINEPRVIPAAKECPGYVTESSYLMCMFLMYTCKFLTICADNFSINPGSVFSLSKIILKVTTILNEQLKNLCSFPFALLLLHDLIQIV